MRKNKICRLRVNIHQGDAETVGPANQPAKRTSLGQPCKVAPTRFSPRLVDDDVASVIASAGVPL